jgi:glutaredoxin
MEIPCRFAVVRRGCPFCHLAKKAILYLNIRLPYNKRIEIYDNYEFEELGFTRHPFIQNMLDEKLFDGYPFIYIDGGIVEPASKGSLIITIGSIVSADIQMDINYGGRVISQTEEI